MATLGLQKDLERADGIIIKTKQAKKLGLEIKNLGSRPYIEFSLKEYIDGIKIPSYCDKQLYPIWYPPKEKLQPLFGNGKIGDGEDCFDPEKIYYIAFSMAHRKKGLTYWNFVGDHKRFLPINRDQILEWRFFEPHSKIKAWL